MWHYPEVRTLGQVPEFYARYQPERFALIDGNRRVSFARLNAIANQVAHCFVRQGVSLGQRVAFLGKNSMDFYFALFGAAKTQGTFTPLNWRLTKIELAELLLDCTPPFAVVEREFEALWREACLLADIHVRTLIIDQALDLEVQVREYVAATCPALLIGEDEGAIQLYTSGTTGKPKGVMLSHGALNRMRLCEHLEPAFQWKDNDSFLNALPNFHLLHFGIAMQCLYNGVSITLVRQFEPELLLKTLATQRPTLLTLTPTMLQLLLDSQQAVDTDFSSLRLTLYAGSPISLGLIQRAMSLMPCQFMQFYGATEAGGAFSLLRPEEHDISNPQTLKSCGRPLPLISFRIVDEQNQEVPDDVLGELLIRTPAIMSGYWKQEDTTKAALERGWYRTGDIAYRDAQGLYYLVDRRKDMIVSGGENVYSSEVENVLSTHPAVAAVAVIGVPHPVWGEAVKAMVIPRLDSHCSQEDLIQYCREQLAAYKVPKSVDFVDSFPLIASGKVSKKELRARYWGASERGIA